MHCPIMERECIELDCALYNEEYPGCAFYAISCILKDIQEDGIEICTTNHNINTEVKIS